VRLKCLSQPIALVAAPRSKSGATPLQLAITAIGITIYLSIFRAILCFGMFA